VSVYTSCMHHMSDLPVGGPGHTKAPPKRGNVLSLLERRLIRVLSGAVVHGVQTPDVLVHDVLGVLEAQARLSAQLLDARNLPVGTDVGHDVLDQLLSTGHLVVVHVLSLLEFPLFRRGDGHEGLTRLVTRLVSRVVAVAVSLTHALRVQFHDAPGHGRDLREGEVAAVVGQNVEDVSEVHVNSVSQGVRLPFDVSILAVSRGSCLPVEICPARTGARRPL
jgi:hypothetical protein